MIFARRIISLLIPGFIGGVVLASLTGFAWPVIGLFLVLIFAFLFLFFILARQKLFLALAMIFAGVILGLVRFNLAQNEPISLPNCSSLEKPCAGLIINDPDRRDVSTRLIIKLDSSSNKILAITDNFTDYVYGDRVELLGKIERPQNFMTDQGTVFDYQNYLLVRGIEQTVYLPKLKIVARGQGSFIKTELFTLKNNFLANLRQALPEPAASLAGGLILGDKGGLGKQTEAEFRKAGVSHIIVLSGYNITIVAESVLLFFSWLTPALAWLLGIGSIFLFVIMTGGEAAAVRSAVMGAIALIARRWGRTYDAGVALIFAGFLMILWNPKLLVFDLGFQLSFLATLGLIYLSPVVEWLFGWSTKVSDIEARPFIGGLKEIICTTTGAQLAVYPWLIYKMGTASLIGFVSNIFILPPIPWAMFASFLTGIAGFFSSFLSLIFSYPTYFLLAYILKMAHFFATLL